MINTAMHNSIHLVVFAELFGIPLNVRIKKCEDTFLEEGGCVASQSATGFGYLALNADGAIGAKELKVRLRT